MNQQRRVTFKAIAAATLFAIAGGLAHAAEDVKIGFLVKQPEEPWFQDEWKFADQAAKEKGFKLVKIGVPSGGEVLTAIEAGQVRPVEPKAYPLADVAVALQDQVDRRVVGKSVLVP